MTRTGTARGGKVYSYYSCAGFHQKGKAVCKGRHIPAASLDGIVLASLKERLLTPDRLASLLQAWAGRQASQTDAVEKRLLSLQREITDSDERLKRIYRSIEDGIAEQDDILRDRIGELERVGPYVVPGDDPGQPRHDLKRPWDAVTKSADLTGVRLHGLRHTYASFGAGGGLGLPVIGRLLGHAQAATTARYAHLDNDPLRRASESIAGRISAALDGNGRGSVVRLRRRANR